jgi:DNA-binding MarR family transcriptional regulator
MSAARMNRASRRGGPRSLLRRGPKAARSQLGDFASKALEQDGPVSKADASTIDEADRRLRNYRKHFSVRTENEAYFRATRTIVTAARRWRKFANDRVKVIGQTMARWETLFLVALSGDEITQSELARLISVEGPTMVRMLDVLAKDGLIARRQNSTDRRVTTNRITAKGMRTIREIMGITDELRAEVMGNIDPRRLRIFIDVLTEILRNIDDKSFSGMDGKAYPFDQSPGTKSGGVSRTGPVRRGGRRIKEDK